MKTTAIIAEYNPFHNGHLYQLLKAKEETKPDTLVVLMSGSFTQRGDICVADKYTRADWAVAAGADIVLELPTVYSLSPASKFAMGAIRTLSVFDDFTLSFGSESGDLSALEMAVDTLGLETKEFKELLSDYMSKGYSLAKARTMALDNSVVSEIIGSPNNILGVEYIKAVKALELPVSFHTVKRRYSENGGLFLSSTEIRKMLKHGEDYTKAVPPFVKLKDTDRKTYSSICLYAINNMTAEELEKVSNISEGFENRLKKLTFSSIEELYALTTKRYTKSTIKRIIASATLNLTKQLVETAEENEPYIRVLALKESRKDLLSYLGDKTKNLYLKASDCPADSVYKPLVNMDEKANKFLAIVGGEQNKIPDKPSFLK